MSLRRTRLFARSGGDLRTVEAHLLRALDELEVRDEDAAAVRRAIESGGSEEVLSWFDWLMAAVPGFYGLATCPRCLALLDREHPLEVCAVSEVMRS